MPKLGKVYLVGAGPGHPELLTIKAAELIKTGDVIVYDRLIQEEVIALARPSAERIYMGKPVGKHDSRQDGNTLGASILGGVLNLSLRAGPGAQASISPDDIRGLLQQPPAGATGQGLDQHLLQTALAHGLHITFIGIAVLGLITFLLAVFIPARELHELTGGMPMPERPAE